MLPRNKLLFPFGSDHKWLLIWPFVLVVAILVITFIHVPHGYYTDVQNPQAIMGTDTRLAAVGITQKIARNATDAAEKQLRRVQALMDRHLNASDISHVNSAPDGQPTQVDKSITDLLEISRVITLQSSGAFDPTCKPILDLWKNCEKSQTLPTQSQLDEALKNTGWEHFKITDGAIIKNNPASSLDLGAIAKGYAIDQATEAMIRAGASGGLVDVGGDIRCFGQKKDGGKWRVAVRNPFEKDSLSCILELYEGAVCTSGNYERFFTIGSRRFNHIIDPQTAMPAEKTASVTVIAPTAAISDAWATALSVLGPKGLDMIHNTPQCKGIEAMIITGDSGNSKTFYTKGFERLKAQ